MFLKLNTLKNLHIKTFSVILIYGHYKQACKAIIKISKVTCIKLYLNDQSRTLNFTL